MNEPFECVDDHGLQAKVIVALGLTMEEFQYLREAMEPYVKACPDNQIETLKDLKCLCLKLGIAGIFN